MEALSVHYVNSYPSTLLVYIMVFYAKSYIVTTFTRRGVPN